HGSLFGYFQNKSLAGNRDDPTFLNYSVWQFGATVSGPVVRDKLHFFISGDFQQRQSAFGNRFQISGVDPVADKNKAGFDNATAERFASILTNTYNIPNPGNALPLDLGNPDRNIFVKVSTSVIENSDLEVSYNFVKASQDVLIRAPTAPTL